MPQWYVTSSLWGSRCTTLGRRRSGRPRRPNRPGRRRRECPLWRRTESSCLSRWTRTNQSTTPPRPVGHAVLLGSGSKVCCASLLVHGHLVRVDRNLQGLERVAYLERYGPGVVGVDVGYAVQGKAQSLVVVLAVGSEAYAGRGRGVAAAWPLSTTGFSCCPTLAMEKGCRKDPGTTL